MKRALLIAAAFLLVLAMAVPSAWADGDDAGSAALGFFLGTVIGSPRVIYTEPPSVVYGPPQVAYPPPPAVVVPAPGDDGYAPPPVYYQRYDDDGPRWRGEWHRDERWHRDWHRAWHHDDDH